MPMRVPRRQEYQEVQLPAPRADLDSIQGPASHTALSQLEVYTLFGAPHRVAAPVSRKGWVYPQFSAPWEWGMSHATAWPQTRRAGLVDQPGRCRRGGVPDGGCRPQSWANAGRLYASPLSPGGIGEIGDLRGAVITNRQVVHALVNPQYRVPAITGDQPSPGRPCRPPRPLGRSSTHQYSSSMCSTAASAVTRGGGEHHPLAGPEVAVLGPGPRASRG